MTSPRRAITQAAVLSVAAVLGLSGCETTSETLDQAETAIRETRVSYQERMDRVTREWICTGMSWQTLLRMTRGEESVMNAIIDGCREETVIPALVRQPTDGSSSAGSE